MARLIRVARSDRASETAAELRELRSVVDSHVGRLAPLQGQTSQRGSLSSVREQVYERDGRKCVNCGSPEELTLDHIVPKSKGGPRIFENLQTMCRTCNQRKGNRLPAGIAA